MLAKLIRNNWDQGTSHRTRVMQLTAGRCRCGRCLCCKLARYIKRLDRRKIVW